MVNSIVTLIPKLIKGKKYRLTFHAEIERDNDQITIREIEESLSSSLIEIIEDYPNDPRGHSSLVLSFTKDTKPIHCVCAITQGIVLLITIYRPDPEQWINWRKRKE